MMKFINALIKNIKFHFNSFDNSRKKKAKKRREQRLKKINEDEVNKIDRY